MVLQELEKLREALSAKKAALDKSWAETKELKRSLAELRAEKDVSKRKGGRLENEGPVVVTTIGDVGE